MTSPWSRRPDGFRAVRYTGDTAVFYCWEQDGEMVAEREDHTKRISFEARKSFSSRFCHESHPALPDAVRARFEGKPSFEEWWAERAVARREEQ